MFVVETRQPPSSRLMRPGGGQLKGSFGESPRARCSRLRPRLSGTRQWEPGRQSSFSPPESCRPASWSLTFAATRAPVARPPRAEADGPGRCSTRYRYPAGHRRVVGDSPCRGCRPPAGLARARLHARPNDARPRRSAPGRVQQRRASFRRARAPPGPYHQIGFDSLGVLDDVGQGVGRIVFRRHGGDHDRCWPADVASQPVRARGPHAGRGFP